MLNLMMAVPGFDRYDLSSRRLIQYGGEPMPEPVVRRALEAFPCKPTQGYGQIEGGAMTFLLPSAASCATPVHVERSGLISSGVQP